MSKRRVLILVVPTPTGWPVVLADALANNARARGWTPIVSGVQETPTTFPDSDAVIAQCYTKDICVALASLGRPTVNVDGAYPDAPFPRVGNDPAQVGDLAARHLIERGCTHLAVMIDALRSNARAFSAAVLSTANGRAIPTTVISHSPLWRSPARGSASYATEDRRLRRLALDLPHGTGIVAWSEQCARSMYELIGDSRHIPSELSMISGSDHPEMALPSLSISAVVTNTQRFAEAAIDLLDSHHGQSDRRCILIPPGGIAIRASSDARQADDPAIVTTLSLIQTRIAEWRTIDDLAIAVGLHRRTLERRFRAVTGRSLGDELDNQRLRLAQDLLRRHRPMNEIATAIGMDRIDSFSRWFKRQTGLTPSQSRHG